MRVDGGGRYAEWRLVHQGKVALLSIIYDGKGNGQEAGRYGALREPDGRGSPP